MSRRSPLKVVRGSGNVFRDLGHENADVEQLKAILAAEFQRLTVRAAHDRTGFAAADFSRIRNADLERFTVDRLMSILNRLGSSLARTSQVLLDSQVCAVFFILVAEAFLNVVARLQQMGEFDRERPRVHLRIVEGHFYAQVA